MNSYSYRSKDEYMPRKVLFHNFQSPGDIVCLTAAIRDLHLNHPGMFLTDVRTVCQEIWENNPYITKLIDVDIEFTDQDIMMDDILIAKAQYPLIHKSNTGPSHFTEGFTDYFEDLLGIRIKDRICKGDIHISDTEKSWVSQVDEITGVDEDFWVLVNGGKYDYTAKWWDPKRMQAIVDSFPEIRFVQVGEFGHHHIELVGDNMVNLIGKTDIRQLIRLVYHSSGVICPVTSLMHFAAAVPVRNDRCYGLINRPCIVVAGGREPHRWESYPSHAFLHTCGKLPCCDNGGCWNSRVVKLNDGSEHDDKICILPTSCDNGVVIPRCMDMITAQNVADHLLSFVNRG